MAQVQQQSGYGLSAYLHLIKTNRPFRRLWYSQIVSNFGDWFGILAVYELILNYSGSALLLGLVIIVKMMSWAVASPYAGYLTDKFNRQQVMVISDVARALIVVGFLFIRSEDLLWLIYPLMALQMMFSALFEPSKSAILPNITQGENLVMANIITSLSWSIIFATGMGIGGIATEYLGTDAVFIVNIISYIVSGVFIAIAQFPDTRNESRAALEKPLKGILDGLSYLRKNRDVLYPALAKGTFTLFFGGLVYMLILLAEDVLMMGSVGLGLLYSARGIGTGVGPIIGRRFFTDKTQWLKMIGLGMMFGGVGYFFVSLTTWLPLLLFLVFAAHCASGFNWVMSTVLLQERAADEFRGRVFSSEWLYYTLAQSFSVFMASSILEINAAWLSEVIAGFSLILIVIGFCWWLFQKRLEN